MNLEQSVLNMMGKALWDPNPTTTELQSLHLAEALGYPTGWRVVRSLEDGLLFDRIYSSSEPGGDMWFNHAGAMEAAALWEDSTKCDQTPFAFKGGHLLPLQPRFDVGDKVQVLYEDEWWDAKILRRKEYPGIFKYQVFYSSDTSRQSGVEENLIRPRETEVDPEQVAATLGFGEQWKAYSLGSNRWKIVSPDGETFKSKKAALDAIATAAKAAAEEGDPPWRTVDHEYLGRRVRWAFQHRTSARRTVDLEQIGTVTGWISETDTDKDGQPGFVSDKTGMPAKLFHVTFDEDPQHIYHSHLLTEQDMEEWEVVENLIPEGDESPMIKKQRTN